MKNNRSVNKLMKSILFTVIASIPLTSFTSAAFANDSYFLEEIKIEGIMEEVIDKEKDDFLYEVDDMDNDIIEDSDENDDEQLKEENIIINIEIDGKVINGESEKNIEKSIEGINKYLNEFKTEYEKKLENEKGLAWYYDDEELIVNEDFIEKLNDKEEITIVGKLGYRVKFDTSRFKHLKELKEIDDRITIEDENGKQILTEPEFEYGDKVKLRGWYKDPEFKNQFIFKDNTDDLETSIVNDKITLYPKLVYEIKFNPGEYGEIISKEDLEKSNFIIDKIADENVRLDEKELPKVKSDNGIFKYWGYKKEAGHEKFNIKQIIDSNIELIAIWEDGISVSFNSDGGAEYKEYVIGMNDKLGDEFIPVRKNKRFIGWFDNNGKEFKLNESTLLNMYSKNPEDEENLELKEDFNNIKENGLKLKAYWEDDLYDISEMKPSVFLKDDKKVVIRPGRIESEKENSYWLILEIENESGKQIYSYQNQIDMVKTKDGFASQVALTLDLSGLEDGLYDINFYIWNNSREQMPIKNKEKLSIRLE